MDVLADVLATTGFNGVLLAQLRSRGSGWGCALEQQNTAGFHLVAEGTCWLRVEGRPPLQLVSGDVVLLPRGEPHTLAGTPETDAVPYAELEAAHPPGREGVVDLGGLGPALRIVCGKFTYDGDAAQHPVLSALPAVIHVPGMSADPELQGIIRLLVAETTRTRPGARVVAARLTDVLFVQVIRAWLDLTDAGAGQRSWLTALRDPRIGAALSLVHDAPQHPWTVEGLARDVAMSRPAFARQFKELVGDTPLAYVSRLRIGLAARLLRETDDLVGDIGAAVGYTSEFTFSRAFSRELGIAPGRYRRAAQTRPEAA
ncbi:AraC family transcriptional regulator (plasmid) [Streptomyces sp. NBC_00335]|uniref:AraC family transcriptional regulator n=1 Tax=unclassified Streptomyces TaxID=2593676 RepID=UPI00224E99A1|nr:MULTISPECIES: AraC family transcriptional regulator [unclassified Streptomyces]MCX5410127.1 AraC family transcriptional regulator [Streptomyces sp. NBC_00086]